MSAYVQFDTRALRNQEVLLAALAACGYGPEKVEVHANPVALFDYHNDSRPERAHIVVRRHNTGIEASNDIGFVRQSDGTFKAIVSEYDSHELCIVDGRPVAEYQHHGAPRFLDALAAAYGRLTADRAVRTILTRTIPGMKAKGVIPRNATVARVPNGRTTRIVVTY